MTKPVECSQAFHSTGLHPALGLGLGRTRRRRPSEARLPEHWGAGRRSTGGWVSIRLTCFAFQLFRTWQ
jgi:hypothetical protein